MHTNWELPGAIIEREQQLGWLDYFPWVLRTVDRNEAQHSSDAILISKGAILFSTHTMLKRKKSRGQHGPKMAIIQQQMMPLR